MIPAKIDVAMTIAITSRASGTGGWEILVAGHLSGEAVLALEEAVRDAPEATLNLAELRGMDEQGEALLRRLRQGGTSLTRLSPFAALLLRNEPDTA
jgi:hypothetical protein